LEQEQNIDPRALFATPQFLVAVIAGTPPIVALPSGAICRKLREYAGVTQIAAAAACQVGLSSIARYESGAVTHSRSLEHAAYRSLLAAFLIHAQKFQPEFAQAIRGEWLPMKSSTSDVESESAA